jgi:hypothetical protein
MRSSLRNLQTVADESFSCRAISASGAVPSKAISAFFQIRLRGIFEIYAISDRGANRVDEMSVSIHFEPYSLFHNRRFAAPRSVRFFAEARRVHSTHSHSRRRNEQG